jgi:DNA/RNA endonuclease G (NUC1)
VSGGAARVVKLRAKTLAIRTTDDQLCQNSGLEPALHCYWFVTGGRLTGRLPAATVAAVPVIHSMPTFSRVFAGRVLRGLTTFVSVLLLAEVARATIGASLQMQLGNPSNATADAANHAHYLIQRDQYALDYSDATHEPNWVAWDLTTDDVGSSGRSSFIQDTTLPAGFYQVLTTDYSGSGYDRGHMCPSADRTITVADNQQVFYMSNMVPQAPDNNQGVWASFETYCRSLASAGNEVLITSGPSGFGGSTIASGVAIPGYTWKVAVVVPLGAGTALSRVTASTRVIAIKVPNIAGVRSTPWQSFVTSVAQIEADTGYTFFTALPTAVANALRVEVDGQSAAGAPVIVAQPVNQTTVVGGSATFTVTASGDEPLVYQWLHDDNEIPGANASTLSLTNVQAADVGAYTVVVTNALGGATSNTAQLIANGLAPSITGSPISAGVGAGSTVTFSVAVTGSPTLTYQWRKNLSPIGGATAATLTLANVQAPDAADYDVVVTNSVGFATSAPATLTVTPTAPSIIAGPTSKAVNTGTNAGLSVTAIGTAPLSYRWRKAGVPLTDAGNVSGTTTATLLFTSATAANAGDYDVVITNSLGSATSAVATLTVNPPPPSTVYWNFNTADPASGLTADITGGTLTQGNNLGTTALITSTSASGSYAGASGGNNAGAAARIGALNQAASGSAYFEFTLAATAGKRLLATGISFGSRSTSTGPQAFQVFTNLDGYSAPVASGTLANDAVWHLLTPAFASVTGPTGGAVTFRIYGFNGTGSPSSGTANWRMDDLKLSVSTVFPPPIPPVVTALAPANGASSVAVTAPITVTFNEAVTFTGSWFTLNSAQNGPMAATVTGGPTTFTLTPPSYFANNDTITVTILGSQVVDLATGTIPGSGNTGVAFTTEAYVPPTPAVVTTQPTSQSVNVGGSGTFTVGASGTAPFSYQWRKNGTAISGNSSALTAALTISGATLADAGSYDCIVSNVAGSDVSHAATLTVNVVPPAITTAPAAQGIAVGNSATFTVAASGTAPFSYQWRKGGSPIAGATGAALVVANATYADSGVYDVVVTNSAGSATSIGATLAVVDAPTAIYWDFTAANATSGVPAGVTGGVVTTGNNNGTTTLLTTTSASGSYVGASGGNNAGAAARTGGLNQAAGGSAYFEFTFTAPAGRQFAATGLSFGLRSTGTGPQAYALYSSADAYAAPLAAGVVPNNSAWALYAPAFGGVTTTAGGSVTFRLFGYNGTGSPGAGTANWRIDDVKLTAGLLALPPVPPSVLSSPAAQTATVGDTVSFAVSATGTAPLSFQWRKDGAPISDNPSALTATLMLSTIRSAAGGNYDCVVTNIAGSATSAAAALTVNKAAATVTLDDLATTYDGTPHAVSVTTAPAGLNVVLTYDGASAAPVNAGSYSVVATIDDPDYAGAATDTLSIAKAPATVTLGTLAFVYHAGPCATTAMTTPAGLNVAITYDGSAMAPVNVGTYAVEASVTDVNYFGATVGTLTIARAPATVSLSDLVQPYDGSPKPVTVTTEPAGVTVITTYNGDTAPPTAPGSYVVAATVDDPNYTGAATGTLLVTTTAVVRHAPSINGGLNGSVQVLLPENITLNGDAWIAGDLLVSGTPSVRLNGHPTYAGTVDATGAAGSANAVVTLNGAATLRHVVRRTDAIALPVVIAPPAPAGTRNVALNSPADNAGDFATIRNLTLNGSAGARVVPAGTYGALVANGSSTLVLGVPGATQPVVYNLQSLTLNGSAFVEVVGPVILNVAGAINLNSAMGDPDHPEWLIVNVAGGGVTLNGSAALAGFVTAPAGTVTLNGRSELVGAVIADRLTINGDAVLESVE